MNCELLIGAPSSGSGKTTFTMGLLRALHDRGYTVQPYKCGPDYIDTLFHLQASDYESVNLDTFMASPRHVRNCYHRYGADADVKVVEGAMGLFDGFDKGKGSAAEIALLLNLPVILVVDARSTAYSIAPLLHGYKTFDGLGKAIRISGVVLNRVASERHYRLLRDACEDTGIPCLGFLPNNPELRTPSRHLGLSLSGREEMEHFICLAAKEVAKHVDVEKLKTLSPLPREGDGLTSFEGWHASHPSLTGGAGGGSHHIAIARDEAFNFTYRANIDALRTMGEVTTFSPLHDEAPPPCDLLYLPGGYPELFAAELSANAAMRNSVRTYAEQGGCILAECGGMMYLCQDIDGAAMCGVLPFGATMEGAKLHLGYRQMRMGDGWMKGHEFHYSSIGSLTLSDELQCITGQFSAIGTPVDTPIYRYKNVIASYTHWYWAETGLEALLNTLYNI